MNEDIKLKLLAGLPLTVNNEIFLYPFSLRKIAEIGYEKYNQHLMVLVAEPKDYDIDDDNITTWDILVNNMYFANENYKFFILDSFNLFLNVKNTGFSFKTGVFYFKSNDKLINIDKETFGKIKYFLKLQNCIISEDEDDDYGYRINYSNEKARQLLEKLKKEKQKLRKVKANLNQEKLYLSDLISILASNSNLSIMEIFELDIYRFQDQFNRMQMLDEYKVNVQALLAGADPKDIKLKHFISKIEKD